MQPEISVLSALSLSGRESQGTSASKAFTTDPLKTAIFLPRLIDIHVYKHACHLIGALPPSIHEPDLRILSRKTSQDWELLSKPVLLRSVFNILLCIEVTSVIARVNVEQTLSDLLASGFFMGSKDKHKLFQ